jgi:hypothetical protein
VSVSRTKPERFLQTSLDQIPARLPARIDLTLYLSSRSGPPVRCIPAR